MINSIIRNKIMHKVLITAIWIGIWQIIYIKVDKEILIVSPFAVARRLLELSRTRMALINALETVFRVFTGFLLALIVGTALAVATSASKVLYDFLYPAISIIKATPVASFIILALVWMQSNTVPVFISFLMVLPVVWGNVIEGIKKTDIQLIEMSKVYKFGIIKRLRFIYIPSVMPYFMASVTVGIGLSWKAGVAAEVLSIPKFSIGSRLYDSKIYMNTEDLFAWTLIVILLSILIEILLVRFIKFTGTRMKINIP